MTSTHRFEGGCHCGNLTYVFETGSDLKTLGLRACMCAFCRAHGARNTSDPNGAMRIVVRETENLERYRFALRTADFLLCKRCGVYIGALLPGPGGGRFTVNVNTFNDKPALDFPIVPRNFNEEDTRGRVSRREERWTPVLEFKVEKT